MHRLLLLLSGCLAITIAAHPTATQAVTADALVAHAGEYLARFIEQFSDVVAEERYVQDIVGNVSTASVRAGTHRELRSDLLLVRTGGLFPWRPFRDVFEVGGAPVRDRDERLAKLFLRPTLQALQQAEQIATESARFNIGAVTRTVNTPMHALLFLQRSLQERFHFALDGRDPDAGEPVWRVRYQEQARPTLIRGDGDSDLPASGRFWIDASGRVHRSELVTYSGTVTAELTTTFGADEQFGILVPIEMHEQYQFVRGRVVGTATYSRFRRFQVSTQSTVGER
jgi:hypothetical protein